jgi:hypothetical protein
MALRPGDPIAFRLTVHNAASQLANADILPVATLVRNGTDDNSVVLTVASATIGDYKVAGTIPAGYQSGDCVQVRVNASVGGLADARYWDFGVLDTRRLSDYDPLQTFGVVTDLNPSAAAFRGPNTLSMQAGAYVGLTLCFRTGANAGLKQTISSYIPSTYLLGFAAPFANVPANGDQFEII